MTKCRMYGQRFRESVKRGSGAGCTLAWEAEGEEMESKQSRAG